MEMHQLRYVVAVARVRKFLPRRRAMPRCPAFVQPAIQKLEDELGERLFDRMKREVKLTSHGEMFLRRAVRILEEVDAARREMTDANDATANAPMNSTRYLFINAISIVVPWAISIFSCRQNGRTSPPGFAFRK